MVMKNTGTLMHTDALNRSFEIGQVFRIDAARAVVAAAPE